MACTTGSHQHSPQYWLQNTFPPSDDLPSAKTKADKGDSDPRQESCENLRESRTDVHRFQIFEREPAQPFLNLVGLSARVAPDRHQTQACILSTDFP